MAKQSTKRVTGLTAANARDPQAHGLPAASPHKCLPSTAVYRQYGVAYGWAYNTIVVALRAGGYKLPVVATPLQHVALAPAGSAVPRQAVWAASQRDKAQRDAAKVAAAMAPKAPKATAPVAPVAPATPVVAA